MIHRLARLIDEVNLHFRRRGGAFRPVIYMFHSVSGEEVRLCTDEVCPTQSPEFFRSFVHWLAKNARIVPIMDIVTRPGSRQFPTAALTFDDGCRDNFEIAFPVLEKHHVPATFFVHTQQLGTAAGLTHQMLKTMTAEGMSIGSHTVSHCHLPKLPPQQIRMELRESKDAIEQHLGTACLALAYPYGEYNDGVVAEARLAGYRCAAAATSELPAGDPFALPRTYVCRPEHFALTLYRAGHWRKRFKIQLT